MSLDGIVEKTSSLVSLLIQRPKMTAKLLSKPPFRFLHDIFIAVMKATGLGEGLFDVDSLDSSKIQDKEAKIAFLNKWIEFVSFASGETLQANPNKIVSGLDVENTNLLLQAFASLALRVRDGQASNVDFINRFFNTSLAPAVASSSNSTRQPEPVAGCDPSPPGPIVPIGASQAESAVKPGSQTAIATERTPNGVATAGTNPSTSDISAASSPPQLSRPTSLTNDNAPSEKSLIEVTQLKLGAIITRPTLKAELLQRPPFRFIQDIVKEVQAATGCLGDTFQQEELTAKIDGASAKAAFLEKLIVFVSTTKGLGLKINIKKVLAGQENPERTNELLQLLADIAQQHASVYKSKASEIAAKPPADRGSSLPQQTPFLGSSLKSKDPPNSSPAEKPKPASNTEFVSGEKIVSESKITSAKTDPPASHFANPKPTYKEEKSIPLDLPFPSNDKTSVAGAAPPKVQELVKTDLKVEYAESTSVPSGIILEGEDLKDDEDDQVEDDEDANARRDVTSPGIVEDEKKHGRLVREILKQQEKSGAPNDVNKSQASGVERSAGIKLGRIGGKERRSSYSQQMIDLLRENIQKTCQSVNPLGKCIDFVDEDLELMRLELEKWRQEQVVQKTRLEKEQKATSEFLFPLEKDLQKIESQISETRDRIQKLRGNIIRNDGQLKLLLERQIKS